MNIYTPTATKIIHNTVADFIARQITKPVHIVQYDNTLPIIAVTLYKAGELYSVPDNASATIRTGKRDGTIICNPALGRSSDKHTLYFEVTKQMSALDGFQPAVIEIGVDGGIAATSVIGIVVEKNPAQQGAIQSTSEFKTVEELAKQARESANTANAAKTSAQTAAANAENSKNAAANSALAALASKNAAATSAAEALASKNAIKDAEDKVLVYANQAKAAKDGAVAAETKAENYANQAKTVYEEFINIDIEQFAEQLAVNHSVSRALTDEKGEFILDSNGNKIDGETIFATLEYILELQQRITVLENYISEMLKFAPVARVSCLEKHSILDNSY